MALEAPHQLDWMAPVLYLAVIVFLVLCPFQVYPRNGVHWLSPDAGIYFDGGGIAYTDLRLSEIRDAPLDQLTAELWLHERKMSRNWGPRAIFAIQDSVSGRSFFFGQCIGRLLLFSPDGEWTEPWYEQFMPEQRIEQGEDYFVAVTIEPGRRAIFTEDLIAENRRVSGAGAAALDLSGRLVLGASPGGRARWWGEMKGLALYRRALTSEQIAAHRDQAREAGLKSLAAAEELIALFPFEEGGGESALSLADSPLEIRIPARFSGLPESLLFVPDFGLFLSRGSHGDAALNVLLFVPLGWLLLAFASRRTGGHRGWVGCGVILAGGCLSFALEATQLLIPERAASPVDVVTNTLGTAIGALAFLVRSHHLSGGSHLSP